jgi:hypothetical protein
VENLPQLSLVLLLAASLALRCPLQKQGLALQGLLWLL